jgi:hypothetical protein
MYRINLSKDSVEILQWEALTNLYFIIPISKYD